MLDFRCLGPLRVIVDGREVELGKGKEQALLALLALAAGGPLSSEGIIDALWDERTPPSAREMVRNYVARLRKTLGDDVIATTPAGYRLNLEPEAVDVFRFERLVRAGADLLEAGDPESALRSLEEALALWRGRPLADLEDTPVGREEILRLEELRLRAIEDRVNAELALGRSGTLVAELERLVRENPYRERLLRQLMLALYRCGRQRDALDRYQAARRLLVEEAGLEPGLELRELQRAILRHDPGLATEPGADGSAVVAPQARQRKHRGVLAAAAAAIAAAAIVVAVLLSTLGTSGHVALAGTSLAVLDPGSGTPIKSVRIRQSPVGLAVSPSTVWVGVTDPPGVVVLDPKTLRTQRVVTLQVPPFQLAAGTTSVWVANGYNGTLTRVDRDGVASRAFRPERRAVGRLPLAHGAGAIWVGSQDDAVSRLDPRSDRRLALIHIEGKPAAIAVGAGGVWVAEATRDAVVRVDPRTNRVVQEIPIGGRATAIAVGDGAVWAVTPAEALCWRIDPRRNAVTASIPAGGNAALVAATKDAVWLGSPDGTLSEIDPKTNHVNRIVNLNVQLNDLVAGQGQLWLSTA